MNMLILLLLINNLKINLRSLEIIVCNNSYNQESRDINLFEFDSCYFERNNMYNGKGGVIYLYNNNISCSMRINNCIFFNCSADDMGGAIYFFSKKFGSSFVELTKICGNYCYTDKLRTYQFGAIHVYQYTQNHIDLVSLSNCNHFHDVYITFMLHGGNMTVNNYNSTKNHNIQHTGLQIALATPLNAKFCTITENNVSMYSCILIEGNSNNFLSYFNIIKNNCPYDFGVVSCYFGFLQINNTLFLNNEDILFSTFSSKLYIFDCIINHLNMSKFSILKSNGNISTLNLQFGNTNTFVLSHFQSDSCFGKSIYYEIKPPINLRLLFFFNFLIF